MNERMRELAAKVAKMTEAERADIARGMPIVTIEGHAISMRNNVLCAMQFAKPCTVIGGFRQWIAHGRCVRKGEHAIYILRPCERKAEGDDGETSKFFLSVPVFDVSQTDDLPTPAELVRTGAIDPAGDNPTRRAPQRQAPTEYYSEQFTAL